MPKPECVLRLEKVAEEIRASTTEEEYRYMLSQVNDVLKEVLHPAQPAATVPIRGPRHPASTCIRVPIFALAPTPQFRASVESEGEAAVKGPPQD